MSLTPHISVIARPRGAFEPTVDELLGTIQSQASNVVRIVLFAPIAHNRQFAEYFAHLDRRTQSLWGNNAPLVALIAQAPIDEGIVAEIHTLDSGATLEYRTYANRRYIVANCEAQRAIYLTIAPQCAAQPVASQAEEAFHYIASALKQEQMPVNAIARQWNYVERITDTDALGQRYQQLNDARSQFYNTTTWSQGYPAATGIGTHCGGVTIDLDAYQGIESSAIDNPLQVAAHCYSRQVLEEGKQALLTTPKFERARVIGQRLYISGTAAIRGEQTVDNNAATQTRITLENIEALLQASGKERLTYLRVYVKQRTDAEAITTILQQMLPNVPYVMVVADICRSNLLVEIEGIGD